MPKFSDIVGGTHAFSDVQKVEIAPGVELPPFRMRALAPFETIAVLSSARADAKAAGVDDPDAGEPIYEAAREIHTLAYALVDDDSKLDAPSQYFERGAETIRASRLLTMDAIAYLFALWEHWYETVSLQKSELSEVEFGRIMQEAAVGNARPFLEKRRGTQWSFTRTLAARHLTLLRSKSDSFSGPSATTSPDRMTALEESAAPADEDTNPTAD